MPDSEISNTRLQGSLNRSLAVAWIAAIFATIGLFLVFLGWPTKPKPVEWNTESTGPGIIRYYGTGTQFQAGSTTQRADIILFENSNGSMKILQPICQAQLGVHAHMKVDIQFHWAPYRTWHSGRGPDNGEECYSIDKINSLGADAQ